MNVKTGKCCEHCSMEPVGDEGCAYPWYGLAPHRHVGLDPAKPLGGFIGSTKLDPPETWPENFREDPDCEGCGTYEYCPHCGPPDGDA